MSKLPSELQKYFEAVREANERIVATKHKQLEPNLQKDDHPWLASENEQIAAQLHGFVDYFGRVERNEKGEVVSGDPAKGEKEAMDIFASLASDPGDWKTWWDVIDAAEKMNAEIDKLLK